ncbi:hypothetical protein QTO34_015584 [Cnephaeus nilssonii]|uniref:EGF-like calcium-binding domain-containing protein n=1 Tax=Cnephaeus nilssonii TaxID=3371016 RepID=A0AA40I4E3_CNENI|nr:hypothetical protein QTO34_015584 [Eptesicus nilssonii]
MSNETPNSPRPQPSRAPEHPPTELSPSLSTLGLSVLLTLSGSEVENSGGESDLVFSAASCHTCPDNASCSNRTHCACKDGYQSRSGRRYFTGFYEICEDIDECKTGLAKCKQKSYCRNEIGSYYCSCVPNLPIFNWVARFTKLNYADCYGKNLQCSPT